MTDTAKIGIIGGGIGGLSLAIALKKKGLNPIVYESRKALATAAGGGGLQIAPNGMNILAELDLVDKITKSGACNIGIEFYNHTGKLLCSPVYQEPEKYGNPAVNISRNSLQKILHQTCEGLNIQIHFEKPLHSIIFHADKPIAVFGDDSQESYDFIVGADGVHSNVRKSIYPNGPVPAYTGLIGFGGFVDSFNQIDFRKDMLQMTFGPIGFFGYGFADSDTKSRLMWWSTLPKEEAELPGLLASSDDETRALLSDVHAGWRDPIEGIIQRAESILKLPIFDIEHLPHWFHPEGNVCLIGDAAHAVSPHSGQGASMALEDALLFARCLSELPRKEASNAFERARKTRVEKIVSEGRRMAGSKRKTGTLAAIARDFMVQYTLPPLIQKAAQDLYNYNVTKFPLT